MTALKHVVRAALLASPLLLVTTACNPECVDKFDCKAIEARPENVSAKKKFTCEESRCVECAASGCPTGDGSGGGAAGGSGGGSAGGGAGGGSAGGTGGTGGAGGGSAGGTGGAGGGSAGGTGGAGGGSAGGTGGAGGGSAGGTGGAGGGAAGGTGGAGGGAAVLDTYVAKMTANQEVPPTNSTATGTVTVTVTSQGDGGFLATMAGTVTGFGADAPTAIHIHNKHAGVSGGFLGGSAGNYVIAPTTGVVTGTTQFNAAQILEIAQGRAYVNIHTGVLTSGAVRGQLLHAGETLMSSQLSGADQVPSNTYPAGVAGVGYIVNADGGVNYEGSWPADVDATMAHIHQGGPGANGGVIITLGLNGTTGVKGFFSAANLAAGNTDGGIYTNVHTSDAGSGLIRGPVVTH